MRLREAAAPASLAHLEYIEEPLSRGESALLAAYAKATKLPYALDEAAEQMDELNLAEALAHPVRVSLALSPCVAIHIWSLTLHPHAPACMRTRCSMSWVGVPAVSLAFNVAHFLISTLTFIHLACR